MELCVRVMPVPGDYRGKWQLIRETPDSDSMQFVSRGRHVAAFLKFRTMVEPFIHTRSTNLMPATIQWIKSQCCVSNQPTLSSIDATLVIGHGGLGRVLRLFLSIQVLQIDPSFSFSTQAGHWAGR